MKKLFSICLAVTANICSMAVAHGSTRLFNNDQFIIDAIAARQGKFLDRYVDRAYLNDFVVAHQDELVERGLLQVSHIDRISIDDMDLEEILEDGIIVTTK